MRALTAPLMIWGAFLLASPALAGPSVSDFLPKANIADEAPAQKKAGNAAHKAPRQAADEPASAALSQSYRTKAKKTEFGEVKYPVFANSLINKEIAKCADGVDDMTFEAAFPGPETVSVTFFQTFEGGAHPNHNIEVRNFNLRTGKVLRLGDIFANPADARKRLGAIAAKKLLADPEMKGERDQDSDAFCLSFNSINEIKKGNPEFFKGISLDPDGVSIVFPVYRTGGEIVKISMDELSGTALQPGVWWD